MKRGTLILLVLVLGLIIVLLAGGYVLFQYPQNPVSQKIQETIINLTPNKDKKMISQVKNIINQVKENRTTTIDSIYFLNDIKDMGIEIPISPYGTDYSSGYITNFNGIYYVSMDNGKQKVSGNEDNLQFSKISLINLKSSYNMTSDQAKLLILKALRNKYDEEFSIVTLTENSDILGFHGYYATARSTNNDVANIFDVKLSNTGDVLDGYYDILIENEYKNLITEAINKVNNKAKIIGFESAARYPYDDKVSKNLSLEDALKNKMVLKDLFIVTYDNLTEDNIKQIEENLKAIHYRGLVQIFQTNRRTYLEVDNYQVKEEYGDGYIKTSLNPKLESAKLYSLSLYD